MRHIICAAISLMLAGCSGPSARADQAPRQAPGWGLRTSTAPEPTGRFDYDTTLALIRRKGFTVDEPKSAPSGPLRAFHAVATGSVDGTNQAVFFFNEDKLVGFERGAIFEIVGQDGAFVRLRLPQYADTDAQCCPSKKPRFHTVRLAGGAVKVVPPIPADPNRE